MSSGGSGVGMGGVYVVVGLIFLLVVRRMVRVFRGTRVSISRTIGFSIYYLAFAAFLIAISYFAGGISVTDLAVYALIGAAGLYGSYLFSNRRIGFWKTPDGSIYYRGAVIIYIVYLIAFVARMTIDVVLIGPQAFTFSFTGAPGAASPTAIDAGIATDCLLSLGSGLLIGRNIRVAGRYRQILAGREEVPDTPPKITYL